MTTIETIRKEIESLYDASSRKDSSYDDGWKAALTEIHGIINLLDGKKHFANGKSTVSVLDLQGMSFLIPAYQRGYRWTKAQVKRLLEDLDEFFLKKNSGGLTYYCLQPLVVSKRDDDIWDIVDGQQRLTTIYIILCYLLDKVRGEVGNMPFSIEYSTRIASTEYLKHRLGMDPENVDSHYMKKAYDTVKQYFEETKDNQSHQEYFLDRLLGDGEGNVRFICYEIEPSQGEKLFSRLNVGKIPLTDAELVKALFFNNIGLQLSSDSNRALLAQSILVRISMQWDSIERSLHDKDLWAFLSGEESEKYETRIELILKIASEGRSPFEYYDEIFRGNATKPTSSGLDIPVVKVWSKILDVYNTIRDWYEDRELFHYIGYLRFLKQDIIDIYKKFKESYGHREFVEDLRKDVFKGTFDCLDDIPIENWNTAIKEQLDNLEYSGGRSRIMKVLVLFNILSVLEIPGSEERFSFHEFYSQGYDIEHIVPQTPLKINNDSRRAFLLSTLEYYTGCHFGTEKASTAEDINAGAKNSEVARKVERLLRLESTSFCLSDIVDILNDSFDSTFKSQVKNNINPELWRQKAISHLLPSDSCIPGKKISEEDALKEFMALAKKNIDKMKSEEIKVLCEKLLKMLETDEQTFEEKDLVMMGIYDREGDDSLSNLVLLDSSTNRQYRNAGFCVKRAFILEREKEGVFIPPCTRNVFNKMYTHSYSNPTQWDDSDAIGYEDEIKRVMKI